MARFIEQGGIVRILNDLDAEVAAFSPVTRGDVIDVKTEYGVKWDNSTDDITRLQNAASEMGADGGVLDLPMGRGRITDTLYLKSGVTLRGKSPAVNHFSTAYPGSGSFLGWSGPAGGTMIAIEGSNGAALVGGGIENLSLFTPSTNKPAVGIRMRSAWQTYCKNVAVKECSTACWQFTAFDAGFTGGNNDVHNCHFVNCSAVTNGQNGIPFQALSPISTGGITLCTFVGCYANAKNAVACLDLSSCDDLFFFGLNCGIAVGGTAAAIELRGKNVASGYQGPATSIGFSSLWPGGTINVRAGDGSLPSINNYCFGLSQQDGPFTVNVEAGAEFWYGDTLGDILMKKMTLGSSAGPTIQSGTGSPLGVVSAPVGSIYLRNDGGAATSLYVKESGAAGNTGWVAK